MLGNSVFLSNENGISENFLSCIKGFKYHFEFTREHGISLEMLQQERASSRDVGGTSWHFSSYGGILQLRWGTQGASRFGTGKSNIHLSYKWELGIALESLQGK